MADDPEIFSQPYVAPEVALPAIDPYASRPRRIPNIGHTVVFFTVALVVLILASISAFAIVMGLHLMGRETADQLLREPRLLIPSMAFGYLVAGAIVWAVFTHWWQQPFAQALHWNFSLVRRRWPLLLLTGIGLSVTVQLLSNFLPIPKSLPIEDFFRTPGDVWMVAIFGTFVAPVFEELAFRGFLLPSLASAWDWLRGGRRPLDPHLVLASDAPLGRGADPSWSIPALLVSGALTSLGFALVHADQLAHAWAPLAILFTVSLVLCMVRLWTQSLAASTLIHATYNFTIFTLLFFATGGFRHLDKIS